jgi:hypothetical protein
MNYDGKLEWFGGNQDALNVFRMFVDLSHLWDDLVDKDKEATEDEINNAFLICLVYLPANPFYRSIQEQVLPMWLTVVSAYQTANKFEREKDIHGIEIAHGLRYAAGNIVAYMVHVCVGPEKAKEFLPDMWKTVFFERYDDYRKEHLDVDSK